jgi:hypothetical protein
VAFLRPLEPIRRNGFGGSVAHPAWSDNSNSTATNPDGALKKLDIYTAGGGRLEKPASSHGNATNQPASPGSARSGPDKVEDLGEVAVARQMTVFAPP